MTVDPLLANLLNAAGYMIAYRADRRTWIATHADIAIYTEADTPEEAAYEALSLLRQRLIEAERKLDNTRAQAQDAARQLDKLTQGERGA